MKALLYAALALGAIATPVLSFAQNTNGPVTRAEVRAELLRLEQAGYNPASGDETNYPVEIQAAEAKVAAEDAARATAANTASTADAVGGQHVGSSMSGAPMDDHRTRSIQCVGPVDFCTPYFGG
jgi:uncharacterized protein DUF4148